MKNIYKILTLSILLVGISCKSEEDGPIFLYEDLVRGSYIRLVKQSGSLLVAKDNLDSSQFTYTVEFVDPTNGAQVETYTVDLSYQKKGESNKLTKTGFKVFSKSEFTKNEAGFMQAPSITLNPTTLLGAFSSVTESNISPEDQFQLKGSITLADGRVFDSENSSSTVEGSFFQGFFDETLFVGCKSELIENGFEYIRIDDDGDTTKFKGGYKVTTTTINCTADSTLTTTVTDTVSLSRTNNIAIGEYSFSDWSFGVLKKCFGTAGGTRTGFEFTEVCGVVSFTETTDEFGTKWIYTSTIDRNNNNWIITWRNPDSDLGGTSTVHFPMGIPFNVN